MEVIRVSIAGVWSAREFGRYFSAVDDLYKSAVLMESGPYLRRGNSRRFPDPFLLDDLLFELPYRYAPPLKVRRLEFNSPGFTDLVGLGAVMREIRETIQYACDRFLDRKERSVRLSIRFEELEKFKIENLSKKADLLRELGYSETETRQLLIKQAPAQDTILDLIADGKIKSARMIDDQKDEQDV